MREHFRPPVEVPPTQEEDRGIERKEKIYERIGTRVAFVVELINVMKSASFEQNADDAANQLHDVLNNAKTTLANPDSIREREKRVVEVQEEIEEWNREKSKLFDEWRKIKRKLQTELEAEQISNLGITKREFEDDRELRNRVLREIDKVVKENEEYKNYDELYRRIVKDREKLEKILEQVQVLDSDEVFIQNLELIITSLQEKRAITERFKDGTHEGLQSFPFRGANELEIHPFHINVFLSRKDFIRNLGSMLGGGEGSIVAFHKSETPYNFFKGNRKSNSDSTIDHEEVHNFIDSVPKLKHKYAMRELGYVEETFLSIPPRKFVDTPRNEILAQIFVAEKSNFGVTKMLRTTNNRPNEDDFYGRGAGRSIMNGPEQDDFTRYVSCMSTAGIDILDVDDKVGGLAYKERNEGDEAKANQIDKWRKQFRKEYTTAISSAREALQFSQELGEDVVTEVHALIFFLKPTRYKEIKPYLIRKYGRPAGEDAVSVAEITNEFNYTSLQRFSEVKEKLQQKHIDTLKDMFEDFHFVKPFKWYYKVDSIDNLRDFRGLIEEVGSFISMKEKAAEISNGMVWHYMHGLAEEINSDRSQDQIEALKEGLNDEEKEAFDYYTKERDLDIYNIVKLS